MTKNNRSEPPEEVAAIRSDIDKALNTKDGTDRVMGNAKHGVYAFFDYDNEPIYVGQTAESLRTRIRRHLTNQRTDAVAMNVLDPFEVAYIEMWPLWDLAGKSKARVTATLNSAEYTVFERLIRKSKYHAILNEKPVATAPMVRLPKSARKRIIPLAIFHRRKHADLRIARRASTIAKLAQVISERSVQSGLRGTLITQARRLLDLSEVDPEIRTGC